MTIINRPKPYAKTYIISMCESNFRVYAHSENEAIELLAGKLTSDSYFSDFEVELMAENVHKTIEKFVADVDLRHCRKHNIYLPKLKIQEVSE